MDTTEIKKKKKDCKKLLQTTICQEISKPGLNGQISRKV